MSARFPTNDPLIERVRQEAAFHFQRQDRYRNRQQTLQRLDEVDRARYLARHQTYFEAQIVSVRMRVIEAYGYDPDVMVWLSDDAYRNTVQSVRTHILADTLYSQMAKGLLACLLSAGEEANAAGASEQEVRQAEFDAWFAAMDAVPSFVIGTLIEADLPDKISENALYLLSGWTRTHLRTQPGKQDNKTNLRLLRALQREDADRFKDVLLRELPGAVKQAWREFVHQTPMKKPTTFVSRAAHHVIEGLSGSFAVEPDVVSLDAPSPLSERPLMETLSAPDALNAFYDREEFADLLKQVSLPPNERDILNALLEQPELQKHGRASELAALVGRPVNQVRVEKHKLYERLRKAKQKRDEATAENF